MIISLKSNFMFFLRIFCLLLLVNSGILPTWVPEWLQQDHAWAVNPDDDGDTEPDDSTDGDDGEPNDEDDPCGDESNNNDDPNNNGNNSEGTAPGNETEPCPPDGDGDECGESPIPLPTLGEKVDLHVLFDQNANRFQAFTFGPGARLSMLHELKIKGVNGIPGSRGYIWWANWTKYNHGSVLYQKSMKKVELKPPPSGTSSSSVLEKSDLIQENLLPSLNANNGGIVAEETGHSWIITDSRFRRPSGKGTGGHIVGTVEGYTYLDRWKNEYEFSNQSFDESNFYRISKFTDLNGNSINYNYFGDNLLIITDASLNKYIIEANYEHRYETSSGNTDLKLISKITTVPAGQTELSKSWSYDYDENGHLKSETFNELFEELGYGTLGYVLNENNVKVQATDLKGQVLDIAYGQDSEGEWFRNKKTLKNGEELIFSRVETDEGYDKYITYPDGRIKISSYHRLIIGDYKVKEVMPNGLKIYYDHDGRGNRVKKTEVSSDNILRRVTEFKYNGENRVIEKVSDSAGLRQKYIYGYTNGFKTLEINPVGTENTWLYDDDGNLLNHKIISGDNIIEKSFEYDDDGNLLKKVDELGFETSFIYNDLGQKVSKTDRRGFVTLYTYDVWGNLKTKTDARGAVTTYGYDALNRKTSETDPLGFVESYVFDENDNLIQLVDKKGIITNFDFNELDQNVKVYGNDTVGVGSCSSCGGTGSNGKEGDYFYRWDGLLLSYTDLNGTITAYDYDLNNKLIAKSVVGNDVDKLIQYENDDFGRRVREIHKNSLGKDYIVSYEYNLLNYKLSKTSGKDSEQITEYFEYDLRKLLTQKIDAKGYVYQYEYDGFGRRVKEVNPQGLVSKRKYNNRSEVIETVIDPSNINLITKFEYDEEGNLTSTIRPDFSEQKFMFDSVGNRVSSTDPLNQISLFEVNLRGEIVTSTDSGGYTTSFSYDEIGKTASVTNHLGKVDTMVYDDKSFMISKVLDSEGIAKATYNSRDKFLNIVKSVDTSGLETIYEYDSLHRRIKSVEDPEDISIETIYEYDELNNIVAKTDAAGYQTNHYYDSLNRLSLVLKADGGQEEYYYDNNSNLIKKVNKVSGSVNLITTYEYDELNRQVKEIKDSDSLNIITMKSYDILGRLIKLTDSKGNETSYSYDKMNRIIEEVYADGGSVGKSYDQKGRLVIRVDQNGDECNYFYNSRDLLVRKEYGTSGNQTFVYNALKRLVKSTDNNDDDLLVVCEYDYDALHRKIKDTQTVGSSAPQVLEKSYDSYGHEITCLHPSGRLLTKTYTKFHQLDKVFSSNINEALVDYNYEYDTPLDGDKRKVIKEKLLNANTEIKADFSYDELGRVTSMSWLQQQDVIVGFNHSYNLYGNRVVDTHVHNITDSESYSYDSAQRFVGYSRQNGFSQSWQLDDLGNWTQFDDNGTTETRTHNAVNEIVSSSKSGSTEHDDNGNMTFHGDKEFVWDTNNRLREVYSGNQQTLAIAKYYYNAMNMRVRKDIDTDQDGLLDDTTTYYYCGQKVCEEQDGNGNFKRDYVHGGQFIDEVIMTSSSPTELGMFSLTDLRYSVYAVVDSDGTVLERYKYDPYGSRTVMNAGYGELTESTIGQEFGYTGRRHDAENSGLMYFRARYYSGELGRFVSRDPLKYVDGMSMYRGYFVVNGVDPSGEINCVVKYAAMAENRRLVAGVRIEQTAIFARHEYHSRMMGVWNAESYTRRLAWAVVDGAADLAEHFLDQCNARRVHDPCLDCSGYEYAAVYARTVADGVYEEVMAAVNASAAHEAAADATWEESAQLDREVDRLDREYERFRNLECTWF